MSNSLLDSLGVLRRMQLMLFVFSVVFGGLLSGCSEPVTEYLASDAKLGTLVGKKEGTQINSTGQAGFLVFGPYVELPAGSYRLVARGTLTGAKGATQPLGVLDVIAFKGERTYVTRPLYGDEQAGEGNIAAVTFDLPKAVPDAEFRIQVTAQASVLFRGYDLSKVNNLP